MNKKILISISIIGIVAAIGIGGTWAYFSNSAVSQGNTFSAGNADLKIRNNPAQPWADSYGGAAWTNLYPGWSDSYNVYLKNDSASPITLRVRPEIKVTSYTNGHLWDEVLMEISWGDGSHKLGPWSIRAWTTPDDNPWLEPVLAQGKDTGPWVIKFSIPSTAGNNIANGNITFDLNFNGVQQP